MLDDPHLAFRGTYVADDGLLQWAPAPRFGATALPLPAPAPTLGTDTRSILEELGLGPAAIDELIQPECR